MGRYVVIARLLTALLILCLPLVVLTEAQAIPAPSGTPSVSGLYVNRNLIVSGDWLIYGTYDIPYTSPPTVLADQAFTFQLLDSTRTTIYGSVTPYSYFSNGYGTGNFFMYFATGPETWSGGYIRIAENPAHFGSPVNFDTAISVSNTAVTEQAANRAQLASNVLAMAGILQGLYSTSMVSSSLLKTVLVSPAGETYYRGACYGIQAMAPTIFLTETLSLDLTSTNWTTAQADIYSSRFSSTFVGAADNATATQFGLQPSMIPAFVFMFPICVGLVIVSSLCYKRQEPGLVAASVWALCSFLMGWIPAPVFGSIWQLMGMYTGYLWFLARA